MSQQINNNINYPVSSLNMNIGLPPLSFADNILQPKEYLQNASEIKHFDKQCTKFIIQKYLE
jgi:hypothetical protein